MQKEIREFIEVLEMERVDTIEDYSKCLENKCTDSCKDENRGSIETLEFIINSPEYIALKALIEPKEEKCECDKSLSHMLTQVTTVTDSSGFLKGAFCRKCGISFFKDKESKKQTLLEFAEIKGKDVTVKDILPLISEYLEQDAK